MTDLRMTPKRLELLQAIADGQVTRFYPVVGSVYDRRTLPDGTRISATRALQALRQARPDMLACPGPDLDPSRAFSPKRWVLTPSGESVLASHREVTG